MKNNEYENLIKELSEVRDAVRSSENSTLTDAVDKLVYITRVMLNELAYTSDRVDALDREAK